MALTVDLAFTPRDSGKYVLYAYVDAVQSGTPKQPIRIESAAGPQRVQLEVPSGTSLFGVVAYQHDDTPEGRSGFVNAGWAVAPIADLAQGQNLDVAIRHNTTELANVSKGTLSVTAVSIPSVPRPRVLPADLTSQMMRAMMRTNDGIYAPAQRYAGAFALSKRLKAPFFYTDVGPLPMPAFLSLYNVVPPAEGYLVNLMQIGAERHGLSVAQFGGVLSQVLQGQGSIKLAGRVYASVLTAFSNALPYLTDYAIKGGRKVMAEWFDRAYLRLSCDCEDFARIICSMHRWIVSAGATTRNPILKALAQFANGYVCTMMLGTVTQPSAGSSVQEHENDASYSGHMWAMLFPREQFAAWQGVRVGGTAWTTAYPHPFVLEGTGYMDPVVVETPEERMMRDGIYRAIRAFPDLSSMPHNIASSSTYHVSPFYRQAMMCYAPPLNDYQSDWVQEFAWINASNLHGASFDTIVKDPFSLRLQPMNPYPDEVKALTYAALATMSPERAPRMGPPPRINGEVLLGAYVGAPPPTSGTPVHFYVPVDAGKGVGVDQVTRYLSQAVSRRNQVVSAASYRVEVLDENVAQVRVTLVVNS